MSKSLDLDGSKVSDARARFSDKHSLVAEVKGTSRSTYRLGLVEKRNNFARVETAKHIILRNERMGDSGIMKGIVSLAEPF